MLARRIAISRRAASTLPLLAIIACALALPFCGASLAQEPAAEGAGQSAYDVPVPAWVAQAATELKREFVMGVARQAVSMAETRATEEVQLLVDAAEDMADAAHSIQSTMSTIGSIDSSFGIPGISRLVTAEGAVRDTLFGFVVWHESASGESPEIAAELETAVQRMLSLGEAARANARKLADNADEVKEALATEDYASIASSSGVVTDATGQLEAIAVEAEKASAAIEEIVWDIQDGGGSPLETEWQQVLLAVSDIRRLASKTRPAMTSLRDGSGASEALSRSLQGVVESIAVMENAESDETGSVRYPSSLFELDVDVVMALEQSMIGESAASFPDDSASAIEWLLSKIVAADRTLAERAVEYTSTEVGRAMDRLEDHYKTTSGFDEAAAARNPREAFEQVDASLRENADLQAARSAARAARAALADGRSKESKGSGNWGSALERYRDAWVHSVEAGGAAGKSLNASTRG